MKAVIETFRPVMGYEGLYEISDQGAVRSLNYNHTGTCKELKNKKDRYGYERICLFREGKRKSLLVHRLVWEAFNGTIPNGMEVDHINTVRDDNRLDNLRCVTPKENNANQITAERKREANRRLAKDQKWLETNREAVRKAHNKPILQIDKTTGDVIRQWECAADAERELGINFRSISKCCLGKRNSAGGFRWCFA